MGYPAVETIQIDQPVKSNGVYTCPSGETFVPVVPGPATAGMP
jgi:hypothetical protein